MKNNYDFHAVEQIPLLEVRESTFMKAVMGHDAMIARSDLSTYEKEREESVDVNVSSLRDTDERTNHVKES